jgi:hypothetical protein
VLPETIVRLEAQVAETTSVVNGTVPASRGSPSRSAPTSTAVAVVDNIGGQIEPLQQSLDRVLPDVLRLVEVVDSKVQTIGADVSELSEALMVALRLIPASASPPANPDAPEAGTLDRHREPHASLKQSVDDRLGDQLGELAPQRPGAGGNQLGHEHCGDLLDRVHENPVEAAPPGEGALRAQHLVPHGSVTTETNPKPTPRTGSRHTSTGQTPTGRRRPAGGCRS